MVLSDAVCLADYCGIFGVCHGTSSISGTTTITGLRVVPFSSFLEPRAPPDLSSHVGSSCDEEEMAALKEKCSLAVESCYHSHSPDKDHRMAYGKPICLRLVHINMLYIKNLKISIIQYRR